MNIFRFEVNNSKRYGVKLGDKYYLDLYQASVLYKNRKETDRLLPSTIKEFIKDGDGLNKAKKIETLAVAEIDSGKVELLMNKALFDIEAAKLISPMESDSKLLIVEGNSKFAFKLVNLAPSPYPFMAVMPNTTIVGSGEPVIFTQDCDKVVCTVELGVVIGKKISNPTEKEAEDSIWGYTVVNDITDNSFGKGFHVNTDSAIMASHYGKMRNTFKPVGPCIIDAKSLGNPYDITLGIGYKGRELLMSNTKEMLFKIPFVIKYISRFITLEPGDIIALGKMDGKLDLEKENAPLREVIEARASKIGSLLSPVEDYRKR